ncbi:hypothetical protein BDN70DRAFT_894788 [Pholiota conissans]|uniref:Uncharacterized protein n=1 Tax=Pholiota conissans TaxID=109636 RepID=A0A9P5Z4C5_9AGAR|nr:hypothetical protein BDN70DRAFT_894788 [Pholiota conissans]
MIVDPSLYGKNYRSGLSTITVAHLSFIVLRKTEAFFSVNRPDEEHMLAFHQSTGGQLPSTGRRKRRNFDFDVNLPHPRPPSTASLPRLDWSSYHRPTGQHYRDSIIAARRAPIVRAIEVEIRDVERLPHGAAVPAVQDLACGFAGRKGCIAMMRTEFGIERPVHVGAEAHRPENCAAEEENVCGGYVDLGCEELRCAALGTSATTSVSSNGRKFAVHLKSPV